MGFTAINGGSDFGNPWGMRAAQDDLLQVEGGGWSLKFQTFEGGE